MSAMRHRVGIAGGVIAILLILTAASPPSVLAQASPGLWEVSGLPGSKTPTRLCVADVRVLAAFEHRGRNCSRSVLRDSGTQAVIHYNCAAAGFGESRITLITPRSLKIQTQGISENAPFNYVLQARRVGDCRMSGR
jgi:hypothetical protein